MRTVLPDEYMMGLLRSMEAKMRSGAAGEPDRWRAASQASVAMDADEGKGDQDAASITACSRRRLVRS